MNNAKVTTYFPKHTLMETEGPLPENTRIALSEYGPYRAYHLVRVNDKGSIVELLSYCSDIGIDLVQKNFSDQYYPERIVKSKKIFSAHTLEGTPDNFVFFRTKYTLGNGIEYIHLNIGNSGEIGLRGGLHLDLDDSHDPDPFINILWDLYQAYHPNSEQLSEAYLKALKDQNNA